MLLKWSFRQSGIDAFFLEEESDLKINQLNRNKTDFQQQKQGLGMAEKAPRPGKP